MSAKPSSLPTLSVDSVAVLLELLGRVQLPVSHPQFEEVAAMWAKAKQELVAIANHHSAAGEAASR